MSLDRKHDVPYLAGSSNDNATVYIDRRVPHRIKVKLANGKGFKSIDPAVPLSIHERSEHRAMKRGKSYEKAHIENGTADERAWVEKQGLDWKHYEEIMDGLLSHIEHEHPTAPPKDLYLKPYPHDKQELLRRAAKQPVKRADGGAVFGTLSPQEEAERPPNVLDKIVSGLGNTAANIVKFPRQYMDAYRPGQMVADTPQATQWAPETALALAGGAAPAAERGAVGAAGGKLLQPEGIRAYHGSPHDFDRFDMSKIGTGEGAQAYGHGLYFAENEGVARSYRDQLAKSTIDFGGKRMMPAELSDHIWREASSSVPDHIRGSPPFLRGIMDAVHEFTATGKRPTAPADLDAWIGYGPLSQRQGYALAAGRLAEAKGSPGRMYEVNINANPSQLINRDVTLAEQYPDVIHALSKVGVTNEKQFKNYLSAITPYESRELRDVGIPGLRYLDRGSRGAGEGSRNYVVFDDSIIDILRKYGMAGLSMLPPATAAAVRQHLSASQQEGFADGGVVRMADGGGVTFDPSKPYEPVNEAPSFDPSKPFEALAPTQDVGRGTAAIEGALSGLSANLRDEIYGASEASGLPRILGGFRAPIGAARMGYEYLTGQPGTAMSTYDKAVAEVRARQKAAQEQYPGTYAASEMGGALGSTLLVPGGALAQGATLPARMGRAAAIGAGYGGVSGFGSGEGAVDSATKAGIGTALGAGAGAATVPLVEGAAQLGRYALGPIANQFRGAFNPGDEAARRVVSALERDIAADPNAASRLTPQEFVAGTRAGTPLGLIDLGGGLTRRLADSAAITSPEGSAALNQFINNRFEGQSARISNWLDQNFGFPNAQAQQQALEQVRRATNNRVYAAARNAADTVHPNGVWSSELERLTSSPDVVDAMQTAARRGAGRAVAEGYGGFNPGVTFDNGVLQFRRGPNGLTNYPDLRFWDYTYRNMRDAANAALRAGRQDEGGALLAQANALRSELDRLIPEYGNARAGAAAMFGAENALEAGQNFFGSRLGNREAQQALARMTPQERRLFQDGYVSRYVESLGEGADRRNALNTIAQSPAARERDEMVLGPQRARELEALLRVEGIMDYARTSVQGNSWTTRRLYDLGLAGGAGLGAHGTYNMDPREMTAGAVMAALASGGRHIDQRVAQRVAELLVSNDYRAMMRGVQTIARNNRFMDALRSTDRQIAGVGAEQTSRVPMPAMLQGPMPGRADQEQQ